MNEYWKKQPFWKRYAVFGLPILAWTIFAFLLGPWPLMVDILSLVGAIALTLIIKSGVERRAGVIAAVVLAAVMSFPTDSRANDEPVWDELDRILSMPSPVGVMKFFYDGFSALPYEYSIADGPRKPMTGIAEVEKSLKELPKGALPSGLAKFDIAPLFGNFVPYSPFSSNMFSSVQRLSWNDDLTRERMRLACIQSCNNIAAQGGALCAIVGAAEGAVAGAGCAVAVLAIRQACIARCR